MAMVLGDLLEMVRQDYLDTLEAAADEARMGSVVQLEVATPPLVLGHVAWADMTCNGQPVTVASEGVFAFDEHLTFGWGDALPGQPEPLQVTVKPFAWDAMPFSFTIAAGETFDPEPLSQWLTQWGTEPELGEELDDDTDAATHREVVHSLQGGGHKWQADMGTAPIDAWQDLLEALLATGAGKVQFGV